MKKTPENTSNKSGQGDDPVGYPLYPAKDDIYNRYKEEKETDPEDPSRVKDETELYAEGEKNEKDFKDDKTGGDLDVPGAELDDQQENIGSEDEENNLYSLGGDNHD